MAKDFLILPPAHDLDRSATDRAFFVATGEDPIVRMFLTAVLTAIGLTDLRAFFRQDQTGPRLFDP